MFTAQNEMNLPAWLTDWVYTVAEGLQNTQEAEKFERDVFSAVTANVDLTKVRHMLAVERMNRLITLLEDHDEDYNSKAIKAIAVVAEYHKNPTVEMQKVAADTINAVANEAKRGYLKDATFAAAFSVEAEGPKCVYPLSWGVAESVENAVKVEVQLEGVVGSKVNAFRAERDAMLKILRNV